LGQARLSKGDHVTHGLDEVWAESGGHRDGLREDGGGAAAGEAVERLVPPRVGRDAQARDAGVAVVDEAELLLHGEFGE
jgi:hypothetical protein